MAAVHVTTMPREPNAICKVQGKPHLAEYLFMCYQNRVYAGFEGFRTLLYVFRSVFQVSLRYEIWVNVPIAIAFPTAD